MSRSKRTLGIDLQLDGPAALLRSNLALVFRRPSAWAAAVALLAWPGALGPLPLGIAVDLPTIYSLIYEVAFLASILGAALCLSSVHLSRGLARPLTPTATWLADISSLGLCSLLFTGLGTLIPLSIPSSIGEVSGPRLIWGVLFTATHLAALAAILLELPMPQGLRPVLLVSLAWWIPALARSQGPTALPEALGAARYLIDTPGARWADTVPVVALLLISWLLATAVPSRGSRPSPGPS